ncbi:MAG: helix-turn-helix transcriptional regulator [Erysipelotrichaceae bacterium]
MAFGDILRNLRNDKKITMKQLGKIIGVTESAVGMYERNERTPNFEILEAIADYFNVDMDYLLGRSSIKNRYLHTNDKSLNHLRFALQGKLDQLTDEELEEMNVLAEMALKRRNKQDK